MSGGEAPAAASAVDAAGRRVLVTGATGFIGRRCLPRLTELGYEVHALSSRSSPSLPSPGPSAVTWHHVDLLAAGAADAVCEAVAAHDLLHLAWDTTPGQYTHTPLNLDWLSASLRLVRSFVAHGGRRLVTAGTCFEYAHSDARCVEGVTPIAPDTLYGTSKAALDAVVTHFASEAGIESAWGRIFFLYGPHEHPDRLVASVTRALLAGREAPCSIGTQVRDFLHVDDVAGALVALLASRATGDVNVASGQPVTIRDLVLEIGEQVGRPELVLLGARPLSPRDPPHIVADVTRLRDEVGFTPRFSLREGVRDTVRWWASERDGSIERASRANHKPRTTREEHPPHE